MTDHEIYKAARDLVAKPGGWITERLDNGRGGYCALGAIGQVAEGDPYAVFRMGTVRSAALRMVDILGLETLPLPHESTNPIADWNNHTNQETVVAGFDKAIEATRHEAVPEVEPTVIDQRELVPA